MIKDINNVADIKGLRLTRLKEQAETVQVRLTMIVVAAKFGDNPSLDLTDFTRLYKGDIISFPAKPHSEALQHLIKLENAYQIEEDDTKKRFQHGKTKVNFIDNGHLVLVTLVAEAYNGTTDAIFKLTGFKILNKEPSMISSFPPVQKMKVTALIKEMKTRKFLKRCQNPEEIEKVIEAMSGNKHNENTCKKQKTDKSRSATPQDHSTQEATPPPQLQFQQSMIEVNPLFHPSENIYDTQLPADTQDAFGSQHIHTEIINLDSDKYYGHEETHSESNPVKAEYDTSMVAISEGNEEPETVPIVIDERARVKEEVIDKQSDLDIVSAQHERKNSEADETRLESQIYSEEYDDSEILDQVELIANDSRNEFDNPFDFPGYIVGTDPLNFQVIGKPFQDIIRHTKFRLLITNFHPSLLKDLMVNTNCLALEFRAKHKVLEFFGYENIEIAYKEQDIIQDKLKRLLEKRDRMNFKVVKKRHHLTVGAQAVWELADLTIDQLLDM